MDTICVEVREWWKAEGECAVRMRAGRSNGGNRHLLQGGGQRWHVRSAVPAAAPACKPARAARVVGVGMGGHGQQGGTAGLTLMRLSSSAVHWKTVPSKATPSFSALTAVGGSGRGGAKGLLMHRALKGRLLLGSTPRLLLGRALPAPPTVAVPDTCMAYGMCMAYVPCGAPAHARRARRAQHTHRSAGLGPDTGRCLKHSPRACRAAHTRTIERSSASRGRAQYRYRRACPHSLVPVTGLKGGGL